MSFLAKKSCVFQPVDQDRTKQAVFEAIMGVFDKVTPHFIQSNQIDDDSAMADLMEITAGRGTSAPIKAQVQHNEEHTCRALLHAIDHVFADQNIRRYGSFSI